MKYAIRDKQFHFSTFFDTETGTYVRTGVLDDNGRDSGIDPFMASYPHLVDVGVMGYCKHGTSGLCNKAGIDCYQNGLILQKDNMSLDDFEWIASQCAGRTNQFALGGRGDPDQHENFTELLEISRKYNIVPNFTTSGYGMTQTIANACKKHCGAVAVSWYRSDYTIHSIESLLKAGVKTNIHYVLDRNSIDEAISRLQTNNWPLGINAVIFLLYKPAGQGKIQKILSVDDQRLVHFFAQFDVMHPYKIGIDSCTVPGALKNCKSVAPQSMDTCEGARFSCYISADMVMMPCSFDQEENFGVKLRPVTIEEAWNSQSFSAFRKQLQSICKKCEIRDNCMGGCPLYPEIVLCERRERKVN